MLYSIYKLSANTKDKSIYFNFSNFFQLTILLFFLNCFSYPIEKTFGSLLSLNFFQAIILIGSMAICFRIGLRIIQLFLQNNLATSHTNILLFIACIIILNVNLIQLIITFILIILHLIYKKRDFKSIYYLQYLFLGLLFFPDSNSIIALVQGTFSLASIFLYYNEWYILNSIGADAHYFIPLLILLIFHLRTEKRNFFQLGDKSNIKLPQLAFTCLLILILF